MAQVYDTDDFPPGSVVQTPSGRVGIVIKHQGAASKRDHFQRLQVHFGGGPRDSVMLQPDVLKPLPIRLNADDQAHALLLEKLRERRHLEPSERALLRDVLQAAHLYESPAAPPTGSKMSTWIQPHEAHHNNSKHGAHRP